MTKAFAIGILAVGVLALAYGVFGDRQHTQEANVGPLDLTVGLAVAGGLSLTRKWTSR